MDTAKIISQVQADLESLEAEKDDYQQKIFEIEQKIETIKEILSALEFLSNPESKVRLPHRLDIEGLGLQDSILTTLTHAQVPLNPVEIREVLLRSGMTATSPKNLLIAIHTALGRIEDRLIKSVGADGKPTYTIKLMTPRLSIGQRIARGGKK